MYSLCWRGVGVAPSADINTGAPNIYTEQEKDVNGKGDYSDTGDNPDTAPGSHPTNWENRPKEKKLKRKKLLNLIRNASFVTNLRRATWVRASYPNH